MDHETENKGLLRELLLFAAGELICLGLMLGVYALIGRFSLRVALGGCVGTAVAVGNYGLTALGVAKAADKARQGDEVGAKRTMSLSLGGRYLLMIGILVAGALSGLFDVVAMVIPLLTMRLVIALAELFRKKT